MSPKSKSKLLHPTRRQVLGMAGTCGAMFAMRGPIEVLLSGLVESIVQRAQANAPQKPRNYLHINLSGGPARWFFDLPLKPYLNSGTFLADPQTATRINEKGIAEYHTIPITKKGVTLNMPTLWGQTIPTSSGGWIPMHELLESMLMIRGVNMLADGHPPNNFKQVRPVQNMPSLTGLVADQSDRPVPAVGGSPSTPYSVYKSAKGIGQTVVPYFTGEKNPLARILSPFDSKGDQLPKDFLSRRAALSEATARALNSLGEFAKSSQPGAENLFALRYRAEKLIREGIGDLQTSYDTLYNKYKNLFELSKTRNMVGINDKPIPHSTFSKQLSRTVGNNGKRIVARNADLRDIINERTFLPDIVEGFAVAEYLITRGYSSTVLWGTTGLQRAFYEDLATVALDGAGNEGIETALGTNELEGGVSCDEHFIGDAVSFVGNNLVFRGIAACLYELIQTLKSAGMFSDTVIQLGAEFSRVPRKDFAGSEHGWMANCTSLFSGAIDRPMVLGNIYSNQSDGIFNPRPTTWGYAAPIHVDGALQTLTIGHSTSTIAHLLRVAPPVRNNGTLVIESSGTLTPTVETAKNIDG